MLRIFGILLLLPTISLLHAQKEPFSVYGLMELQRISDPQLAPDGLSVAFVVQTVDLAENSKPKQIFTVLVTGGNPRRITWTGTSNSRPRWSPDSSRIAFVSNRGGSSQIWIMDADGSSPRQVTDLSTEASGVLWSPDGENLLFTSDVYPDCEEPACNDRRIEADRERKIKARIYDSLLYRHWDHWRSKKVTHLMLVPADGGEVRDLTPGTLDAPPFSLTGFEDYSFSPDGREICYVMKPDPNPAANTNSELYTLWLSGGEPVRLTHTPGADNAPRYSPDGRYLAFLSQMRGGYESDKWRLAVMRRVPIEGLEEELEAETAEDRPATGERPAEGDEGEEEDEEEEDIPRWRWEPESIAYLTDGLDRPVNEFTWSPDSKRLFFTTEDRGRIAIQMMSAAGGAVRGVITGPSSLGSQQFSPDGRTMIYTEQSGSKPVEIYAASSSGSAVPLTNLNYSLLERYQLTPFEDFRVEGAGQTPVHSFILKPPEFDESRRYPVIFLLHGGPQGAWGEKWSYRWNAQVFAGAGYLVVMPNPRGSVGYGQKFTDEISTDYGGKVFEDVIDVVDYVASLPYVRPDRMSAAGGSYGGYLVNWLLGHTQRFQAFVSHAGLFDMKSWAMETEELWFPIWDQQGMPWENPRVYERWSPSRFISDFFTPTLVIHGELDFRVPYGQGLQLFTALRMQDVPSKLLIFPDEGHWVLKPQNSILWYDTFLGWIDRWLKRDGADRSDTANEFSDAR